MGVPYQCVTISKIKVRYAHKAVSGLWGFESEVGVSEH
jgi:hypothetical protein